MYFEGWKDNAIYSRNNGELLDVDLNKPTILLLIPKLATPICSKEILELNKHTEELSELGINLYCASTDSPEVADWWFGENPITYTFLHLDRVTKPLCSFIDDLGYSTRTTIYMDNDKVIESHTVDVNMKRDIDHIYNNAMELFQNNNSNML